MKPQHSHWDDFLDKLAFGGEPFTMPAMPGLALPATGDGRREHLPYVRKTRELNPRIQELVFADRKLTPAEMAELEALEIQWPD